MSKFGCILILLLVHSPLWVFGRWWYVDLVCIPWPHTIWLAIQNDGDLDSEICLIEQSMANLVSIPIQELWGLTNKLVVLTWQGSMACFCWDVCEHSFIWAWQEKDQSSYIVHSDVRWCEICFWRRRRRKSFWVGLGSIVVNITPLWKYLYQAYLSEWKNRLAQLYWSVQAKSGNMHVAMTYLVYVAQGNE